jgi:hypothetical protein
LAKGCGEHWHESGTYREVGGSSILYSLFVTTKTSKQTSKHLPKDKAPALTTQSQGEYILGTTADIIVLVPMKYFIKE